jgi:hypothetical protein
LACREALSLAEDLNLSKNPDCKTVVTDISDGSMGRYGTVVSEIKSRSASFSDCKIIFEGRASNFEAHNLARNSLSLGVGHHLWLGTPYSINIHVNIIVE